MKKLYYFIIFFVFLSCAQTRSKEVRLRKPCEEVEYFKNLGVFNANQDTVLCTIESDTLKIKVLFINCEKQYQAIESKVDCSRSFAKYFDNKLITFDSINSSCKRQIKYIKGIPEYDDMEILPLYLK